MPSKPKDPYPKIIKRALNKILPDRVYRKYFGRHEDESTRIWKHLSKFVDSTDAILDIGAFVGSYCIAARENNLLAKIIAFEPNPFSADTLRHHCQKHNIIVEELAVLDTTGVISFTLNSAKSGMNYQDVNESKKTISVQAVSLDEYVNFNNITPSLIKIETEGAEGIILRGACSCLSKYKPIILCEILSDDAGLEVMNVLPADYIYYHIEENSGISISNIITRNKWRNRNWLLVPALKKHLIDSLPSR